MSLKDSLGEISSHGVLVRMITYAIRCPDVAMIAVQKLDPAYFDEATQFEFQSVWLAARLYWLEFSTVPPMHSVFDLTEQIMVKQGLQEPLLMGRAKQLVAEIYAFEETPWNVEYGKKLLDLFFNSIFTAQLSAISQTMGGLPRDDVRTAIEKQHQVLSVSEIRTIDPFDFDIDTLKFAERTPIGVSFVDLLLGGGTLDTECYGVLGPSGGGKTVISLQLSCSLAERKQHVEYFTYEQNADDLRPRALSCAAKVSSSQLTNAGMSETTKARLLTAKKNCQSYLHIHDRSSEGNNLVEIANVIKRSIDAGKKPRLVVIDWIWPLILRMTAASDRRGVEERKLLQATMDGIKSMASQFHVAFWVVHQLSTEQAKKSPGKKPAWFNSAEAGSFAWLLHYCFAIGQVDKHGFCWFVGSKARNTACRDALVRLNGEYNCFEATDKRMVFDDSRGRFISEDGLNKIDSSDDDDHVDDNKKPKPAPVTPPIVGESNPAPMDPDEKDFAGGSGGGVF